MVRLLASIILTPILTLLFAPAMDPAPLPGISEHLGAAILWVPSLIIAYIDGRRNWKKIK